MLYILNYVCVCSLLDGGGFIHILMSLSNIISYQAYVLRVQYIYQLKTRNIVVTVGDDEDFTPLVRVWNIDKVHTISILILKNK